jgi:uncharacterized damage-inducible protein DinB
MSQLLYLLDSAFEGTAWHSLLGNLRPVTPEDWLWVPPGGKRSIRDIVQHVGGSKLMYENHAFGDRKLTWDDPVVDGGDALATLPSALVWLKDAQKRLRQSIALLDDAELLRQRMTNWGEQKETRWIVTTMIEHDLYHAGEINHLRSLHGRDDRWAYEQASDR